MDDHAALHDSETAGDAKYLTFLVDGGSYGLDIRYVTEIIGLHAITAVPDVPPYVRGIINLRGRVIPVVDIRARFGFPDRAYDERTCIIVVRVAASDIGLVVDTVSEVLALPEDQISPPPTTASGGGASYLRGVGRIGPRVTLLLDAHRLLYADHLSPQAV